MKNTKAILFALFILTTLTITAQKSKVIESFRTSFKQLPEYVVVTSENTKVLGGIDISIDTKKSDHENALKELEALLQNRKKLRIRNQTDLLNAMSHLGFDYVDAFNASSGIIDAGTEDDFEILEGESKFRINMVFRKKEKHRS